ncbi:hypothetical protein NQ314_013272 [Rhamnusium bicolor]|uniref:Uncharacterized protein n=1 Tax=Rhamnusium bicolor TaxID=1586634 RepID=A0AAV8X6I2_9CUCU|nr:hypothetical protein NQ314_013272 [Rhamnusium bicolor]
MSEGTAKQGVVLGFAETTSNIRDIGEGEIATESQVTEIVQGTVTSDVEDGELEETYSPLAVTNHQPDTQSVASTPSHTQSTTSSTRKLTTSRHRQQKENKEYPSSVDAMVNYFENKRGRYDKTVIDVTFSGYAQIVKSFSHKRQVITKMKIVQIIAEQELEHIEEMESLSRPRSNASDFSSSSLTSLPASSPAQPEYIPIASQSKYRSSLQPYINASQQQNLSSSMQTYIQLDVQPHPQLSEQSRTFSDQNVTQPKEIYTQFQQRHSSRNSSVASYILHFNPSE